MFSPEELRLLAVADRFHSGSNLAIRRIRKPGSLGCLTEAQAHALFRQGMTNAEIAEASGVAKNRVANWRRQHGYPTVIPETAVRGDHIIHFKGKT